MIAGSGIKNDPYIVTTDTNGVSVFIQRELIESVLRLGEYDEILIGRSYHNKKMGLPGNLDICETIVSFEGGSRSVWFDLTQTPEAQFEARQRALKNQIVVDKSQLFVEPNIEIGHLNESMRALGFNELGLIHNEVSNFDTYGVECGNPVVVAGLLGLHSYLQTLRFPEENKPIKAEWLWTFSGGRHPVDCLRVYSDTMRKDLLFCIYGDRNDRVNPYGFTRVPFSGVYQGRLIDFIDIKMLEFYNKRNIKKAIPACSAFKGKSGSLAVVFSVEMLNAQDPDVLIFSSHIVAWSSAFNLPRLNKIKGFGVSDQSCGPVISREKKKVLSSNVTCEPDWESCWFSGLPADKECEFRTPVYRETRRGGFLSRSVEWQEFIISIPRSKRCLDYQVDTENKKAWGARIGAGLFFVCSIPTFEFLSIAIGFIGLFIGQAIGSSISAKKPLEWRNFDDWKQHPDVLVLIGKGWQTTKPYA